MNRVDAHRLLELVLDPSSFVSWDESPVDPAGDPAYTEELTRAREKTGINEAVITGSGSIDGHQVAMIASEFAFLGGSIGVASAERIVRAIEHATAARLPLVAMPSSGGTRMQEGTLAFACMIKIAAAVTQHKTARLPYIVYLRHPTTGGVFASWGSLGHVTYAEPEALLGFLGPRVYEALHDRPWPRDVQTSENLYRHGVVDAVVAHEQLRRTLAATLAVLRADSDAAPPPSRRTQPAIPPSYSAWETVIRSRRVGRPSARTVLARAATSIVELSGSGRGERDTGLLLALAKLAGQPCVLSAHDRHTQSTHGPIGPAALRTANRGMQLAAELGLPLVTVIDTAGAALSKEAEEGGLAGEIARGIATLVTLPTPTLCLLLGQGCGGGALAQLPVDRVIAAQHAWIAPLPPEGASAIMHRSVEHAAEVATAHGVRAADLLENGIVDRIVPERPDATDEPDTFCRRISSALHLELTALLSTDPDDRLKLRVERYRRLGRPAVVDRGR
ncbi:carboxyl transferase domain-containing protein [Haloechinothrix halophila]|uniref:carboxyl transferase domain-containing protein n=1 Tax=Haloechinothrix halophila TaxID=1069073 RepID=UPI000422DEDD|nr:carboxyl transferase domain-containing protein [Haloechinothrix halophila]